MTIEEAKAILAIEHNARMKIATAGEIPADWVAKQYGVTRGQGLSLIIEAHKIMAREGTAHG